MEDTTWKINPLKVIDDQFITSGSDKKQPSQYFHKLLSASDYISQVPVINAVSLESIPHGHLVCMRGMVQDMFDPEIYVDTYCCTTNPQSPRFARYRDISNGGSHDEIEESSISFSQRQPLYIVPIPGEAQWVKDVCFSTYQFSDVVGPSAIRPAGAVKRSAPQEGEVDEQMEVDSRNDDDVHGPTGNKMSRGENGESVESANGDTADNKPKTFDRHFPFESDSGTGCLVRIYDKLDSLKLTDMVEVIGVYSPPLPCPNGLDDLSSATTLANLTSHVPCIHAVVVNRMPHCNPLLPRNIFDSAAVDILIGTSMSEIRDLLFVILLEAFLGDTLAAEYTLLHLLSVVGNRDSGTKAHFPLNLSHCRPHLGLPQCLFSLLSRLTTHCLSLPITRTTLSSPPDNANFMPVKDHTSGRLKSGFLQVPAHTQFVLDETEMSEGELDSRAVCNLRALLLVAVEQELPYDFQFYTHNYHTDIRLIVVSDTKSIIRGCTEVPWFPTDPVVQSMSPRSDLSPMTSSNHTSLSALHSVCVQLEQKLEDGDTARRVRQYLTALPCRQRTYTLDEALQEKIHNDFVRMRKNDGAWMSVEQFTLMLNLLKLETLSYGKSTATQSLWDKVVHLELDRRKRVMNTKTEGQLQ